MNRDDIATAIQLADDIPLNRRAQTWRRYERLADAVVESMRGEWVTIHAETAHYVSPGHDLILCDRLPRPVTLVVKLAPPDALAAAIAADAVQQGLK